MHEFSHGDALVGLAAILVLGIGAQWFAWRLHLPSILVLLVVGLMAGPVTHVLDPDALLGELLFPIVSVSVGIILFEGGLGLRFKELTEIRGVVVSLVTLGALATGVVTYGAAHWILGFDVALSLLLSAVLVVTGPTVILPLLRYVRPSGQVASVLKWEGIVIDPIGATLSVLVFELILHGEGRDTGSLLLHGIGWTLASGAVLGLAGAGLLVLLLRHYWVPDYLQETVALMVVVAVFVGAHLIQEESGLLATTVMGVALANQRVVTLRHIVEFKENLGVLLISGIFILLAARLRVEQLQGIGWEAAAFVAVLIVIARPACVGISTLGSALSWRERIFVAAMAPRGIVAASVATVFALRLEQAGHAGAERLVPITFLVIVGTVTIYGLSVTPLARRLGLAQRNPQGVLFVGAQEWARAIAAALVAEGIPVRMVDTNWSHIRQARMAGLPTHYGSAISASSVDEIGLAGLGRILAVTPNDEANSLAALHFNEVFSRAEVYQLAPPRSRPGADGDEKGNQEHYSPGHLRGRFLFAPEAGYAALSRRFADGAVLKSTSLTEEFGLEQFRARYGESAIPLFLIDDRGRLNVITASNPPEPRAGHTLIALVNPVEDGRDRLDPPDAGT